MKPSTALHVLAGLLGLLGLLAGLLGEWDRAAADFSLATLLVVLA